MSFISIISTLFYFSEKDAQQILGNKFDMQKKDSSEISLNQNENLTIYKELIKKPIVTNSSSQTYRTKDYINFSVTKTNSLGQFFPDDLVTLPSNYTNKTIRVSKLIENDLINMLNQAKSDGIDIRVISGFRSYSEQLSLFNYYVSQEKITHPTFSQEQLKQTANQYSAIAGHSEHQLGTTVDLASNENSYQLIANDNLKYIQWINLNASKYNFKISYTKNNFEYIYEPWHLRWFGN